jgi:predicted DNA-binding transcriptional regulator YafY
MPENSYGDTLHRLRELEEILPSKAPGATSSALTKLGNDEFRWGISKRTVERYLKELRKQDLALTVENPKARKRANETQHWIAGSGPRLRTPRMGTPDALALHLIERVADSLLPPEIVNVLRDRREGARTHLQRRRKVEQQAAWANKVAVLPEGFALRPPTVDNNILVTLQRALLVGQQVQCAYRASSGPSVKSYPLEPRALVLRGAVLYLVATRPDRPDKAIAWYRVHRFQSVKWLDTKVSGIGFDLKSFLAGGGGDYGADPTPINFQAWVSTRLAETLRETPISEDMTLRSAVGGAIVTATLLQSWPFESWILSRGRDLRVIEPIELRDETANRLRAAAEAYG